MLMPPTIWIDNDGCPKVVRDMVFQGAKARQLQVKTVANRYSGPNPGPWVESIVVTGQFDAADDYIITHGAAGDVVISDDIPLAGRAIAKGITVLSTRGELMDAANIGERLAMRNLMQELRSAGDISGGPPPQGPQDKKRFADALDRLLTRVHLDFKNRFTKHKKD